MPRSSQHHITPDVRDRAYNLTESVKLVMTGSGLSIDHQLGVALGIVTALVTMSNIDPMVVLQSLAGGLARVEGVRKVMKVREKNRLKIAKRRARLKGQKKTAVTPVKKSRPRARRKKKR